MSSIHKILKNTMIFFAKLKLYQKLILCYIIILAIPVIVFGIYSFNNFKSMAYNDILKSSQQRIELARTNIIRNIETCERAAQAIANNDNFLEFISQDKEYITQELIDFKFRQLNYLETVRSINLDIRQIRVFINNPNFREIGDLIVMENRILNTEIAKNLENLNDGSFWLLNHNENPEITKNNNIQEVVSLYKDLSYPKGKHIGFIEVSMPPRFFYHEIYDNIDNDSPFVCIEKDTGKLYSNSGKDQTPLSTITPFELHRQLTSNINRKEGYFLFTEANVSTMVVYAYIEKINAYICQLSSLKSISKKLDQTRNFIIIGILGIIVILSLITSAITFMLLKKVEKIIHFTRRVQDGDLSTELELNGYDEISELGYHINHMLKKTKQLFSEVIEKQAATKSAEISALQAQINAHFIYNVLEAINMMAEIQNQYDISKAITSLGRLLRYSMTWKRKHSLLRDEIEHIKNYSYLLGIRYRNQIDIQFHIENSLLNFEVPKMSLQPLVENSVVHGILPAKRDGIIKISAYVADNVLHIKVSDNGIGIDDEKLASLKSSLFSNNPPDTSVQGKNNGIGLKNIHDRIKLYYGKEYGLEIFRENDQNITVHLQLPIQKI